MTLKERIALLVKLGDYIQQNTDARQLAMLSAERHNRWLTKANSLKALMSIATEFLAQDKLEAWAAAYPGLEKERPMKTVGLVLAGNIPAVGFHDVLSVFLAGHRSLIKYSDKDSYLIAYLVAFLVEAEPAAADYFVKAERLQNFDAVIATGSNNSAMYFKEYFSKYPHIIRRNRNSVAVLDGSETDEELLQLGTDIFRYFGLGCRSVSKLYVPKDYDFPRLFGILDYYKDIMDHTKYRNNFEYNRSIYLLNNMPHYVSECVMAIEDESMLSRISSVHYEHYENLEDLDTKLEAKIEDTQCIATKMNLPKRKTVALGQTQSPSLSDYADGVDTVQFLLELK